MPVLDIKYLLENRDIVLKALSKRMSPEDIKIDAIEDAYNRSKKLQQEYDQLRAEQRQFNDQMASVDKSSPEFQQLLQDLKEKSQKLKSIEQELRESKTILKSLVEVLPNIPDDETPAGGKESNVVLREWGTKPTFDFDIKDHVELSKNLGILDFERAAKMSGNNFVMYRGLGARLEWAFINFFVNEHNKNGFEMVLPPHLVTRESAYVAGQLPKFEDDVFWTKDGRCLVPTAETALANIYRNEVLSEEDLPKKFFAYTPCYRKEAGSYRAGEKGTIRMHEFNKVEMFVYSGEEDSDAIFDELVNIAETIVQKLGLHYRVTNLAAGDCAAGAAKTYDIEVWLPTMQKYYEVSSVSNVREYQARRGNMRYRDKEGNIKFMHTLNGSGLATSRLIVAVLETFQQKDGSIIVPEVLRPFMGGIECIK